MRKNRIIGTFLGLALASSLSLSLQAQSKFYGDFLFGFRIVDTSGPGADYKYKEDYNLHGGARLYNFNMSYTPENGFKKLFDRLDIRMYNIGGDPFETFSVALQKHGQYLLQYDRKKSTCFYHDLNLGDGGEPYDLHTFDFDRLRDSGLAKIWLAEKADLYLGFDRSTKKGASTTTLDINRVEFEMDKSIQEESKEIVLGLNIHFHRYSLVIEEKFMNYKNENSLFLPGYADGGPDAIFPTSLNYYFLNQPCDLKSNTHTFKFNARPLDRLFLTGSVQISRLDMDLDYSEQAQGVNYLNRKFQYTYAGTGAFDRDIQLYEVDASFTLLRKLTLVSSVRYHNFNQTGSLAVDRETEAQDYGYHTLGVDAGFEYQFSPQLALTLGYRFEDRNLDGLETVTYEFDTTKNGAFGNLKWDLSRLFKLTLDYEHSQHNDPFTLISPTAFNRLRITARYQANALNISGSYLWSNSKTEVFEDVWKSSKNQFNLRLGYHADRFNASGGFSYIQAKRQGDRTVTYPPYWTGPGGTFLWEILYEGKSSLLDATLSFDMHQNWKIGGYANYYFNKGSWKIERTVLKAYIEYAFAAGYMAQLGYRFVDYKEKKFGYNDYKANIIEFSFGHRWK
jgi:opacity protein-like surface antigen